MGNLHHATSHIHPAAYEIVETLLCDVWLGAMLAGSSTDKATFHEGARFTEDNALNLALLVGEDCALYLISELT